MISHVSCFPIENMSPFVRGLRRVSCFLCLLSEISEIYDLIPQPGDQVRPPAQGSRAHASSRRREVLYFHGQGCACGLAATGKIVVHSVVLLHSRARLRCLWRIFLPECFMICIGDLVLRHQFCLRQECFNGALAGGMQPGKACWTHGRLQCMPPHRSRSALKV